MLVNLESAFNVEETTIMMQLRKSAKHLWMLISSVALLELPMTLFKESVSVRLKNLSTMVRNVYNVPVPISGMKPAKSVSLVQMD
jgi:hypothetical protein